MNTTIYKISRFLTSLSSVLVGLLLLIAFLVIETQTLFERILPQDMAGWKVMTASWLISIVYEFTVLLFAANKSGEGDYKPAVLAAASFFIHVYFWQAYDLSVGWVVVAYRYFISAMLAYMNYIYSDLFVTLWCKQQAHQTALERIPEAVGELDRLESEIVDRTHRLQENTCPVCGEEFQNKKAVAGHMRTCKSK